ncbi:MAG: MarR family transcriptional regulator [Candidatus Diapherotrites archaeon]
MGKNEFEDDAMKLKMLAGIMGRLAMHNLKKRLEAEKIEVNPLGLGVLKIISSNDFTISELSQKLFIASATLVPVIDCLEKDGLIVRSADPKDRRRNPLSLTPKGEKIISKIHFAHKDDLIVKVLSKIGRKKTGQLIQILCELVDGMSEDSGLSKKILCSVNNGKKKRGEKD